MLSKNIRFLFFSFERTVADTMSDKTPKVWLENYDQSLRQLERRQQRKLHAYEATSSCQAVMKQARKRLDARLDVLDKDRKKSILHFQVERAKLLRELERDILPRSIPLECLQIPRQRTATHARSQQLYRSLPAHVLFESPRANVVFSQPPDSRGGMQLRVTDFIRSSTANAHARRNGSGDVWDHLDDTPKSDSDHAAIN